jgi:hypothetical protein
MKEEKLKGEIVAYCVKCKDKRTMVEGVIKTSDSGRRMAVGKCLACGTKVNRILGRLTDITEFMVNKDKLCDCDNPVPISRPVTPHDKLLEKINGPVFKETSANTIAYWRSAIRTVVELTKPNEYDSTDIFYWKQKIFRTIEEELR